MISLEFLPLSLYPSVSFKLKHLPSSPSGLCAPKATLMLENTTLRSTNIVYLRYLHVGTNKSARGTKEKLEKHCAI